MAVEPKVIEDLIKQGLPDAQVSVTDLVGDGDHLQATVISSQFAGKSLLEQHQMVYAALKDTLKQDLHALALKTQVPQ